MPFQQVSSPICKTLKDKGENKKMFLGAICFNWVKGNEHQNIVLFSR